MFVQLTDIVAPVVIPLIDFFPLYISFNKVIKVIFTWTEFSKEEFTDNFLLLRIEEMLELSSIGSDG